MRPAVKKIVLRRNGGGDIGIESANGAGWNMFPWSPSWGEINFMAYDMATVEYHNELYGWLQEHHKLAGETFLGTNGVQKTKDWTKEQAGKKQVAYKVTLCAYVRNSIHDPENKHNMRFMEAELMESISTLHKVI